MFKLHPLKLSFPFVFPFRTSSHPCRPASLQRPLRVESIFGLIGQGWSGLVQECCCLVSGCVKQKIYIYIFHCPSGVHLSKFHASVPKLMPFFHDPLKWIKMVKMSPKMMSPKPEPQPPCQWHPHPSPFELSSHVRCSWSARRCASVCHPSSD
jgi:hypothetical protein